MCPGSFLNGKQTLKLNSLTRRRKFAILHTKFKRLVTRSWLNGTESPWLCTAFILKFPVHVGDVVMQREQCFILFGIVPNWGPFGGGGVIGTVKHLTNVDLEGNPAACLLHLSKNPIKKYKASFTIQLLNAAKACIPLCWRSEKPLSKSLWFSNVNELRDVEDLTQQGGDLP